MGVLHAGSACVWRGCALDGYLGEPVAGWVGRCVGGWAGCCWKPWITTLHLGESIKCGHRFNLLLSKTGISRQVDFFCFVG